MGKATALKGDPLAKRADETTTQWKMRVALSKAINDETPQRVNPFAKAHGDYVERFITHGDLNTRAKVAVNRGGDAVARWEAAGRLSITQLAVIGLCQRLWRLVGLNQRVTADYGERIPGTGCADSRAVNEIEARDDLKRIEAYFPGALREYWRVFERVVRHGETAAGAGAGLGYGTRSGADRAHTIVCFVADIVATNERL